MHWKECAQIHIDWCCFYYSVRNSIKALPEALFARIFLDLRSWCAVINRHWKECAHIHTCVRLLQICAKTYRVVKTDRMPYLLKMGHFPQKSPIISGSFTEKDMRLEAPYGSLPPCILGKVAKETDSKRHLSIWKNTFVRMCVCLCVRASICACENV